MSDKTSWRDLPASRSFDWLIATRLGYCTQIVEPTVYGTVWLIQPDGKPVGYGGPDRMFAQIFQSEAEARTSRYVLAWSTDLNATSQLGPCLVWQHDKTFYASFHYTHEDSRDAPFADPLVESVMTADTEALARCRAWLLRKEREDSQA